MQRYFLEVSYTGTDFSGFASQKNNQAVQTVQGLIEAAILTITKQTIATTTSSRTDAGVHAKQNFIHFDTEIEFTPRFLYSINSLLPFTIVVKNIYKVSKDAHSRFAATSREYHYFINTKKNPFWIDRAWYFPYKFDAVVLQQAASLLQQQTNFETFSKKHTDVFTHDCTLFKSHWQQIEEDVWKYTVEGNRFLRGMVRALVGTMMQVANGNNTIEQLQQIIDSRDCMQATFSTPGHGLVLAKVNYPDGLLIEPLY